MRASASASFAPRLLMLLLLAAAAAANAAASAAAAAAAAGPVVPPEVPCLSPLLENCTLECSVVKNAVEADDGTCRCEDADAVLSSDFTSCLVTAFDGFGAACEDSGQCVRRMGPGAACLCPDDRACDWTCQCQPGFHYLRGRCWKSRGLGEKCSQHEECVASWERDALVCSDVGVCACAPNTTYQPQPNMCRRLANACEPCLFDPDCDPDNTGLKCTQLDDEDMTLLCMNSTIKCDEGEEGSSTTAAPPTTTGAVARADEGAGQQTPGNRTVCNPGYFWLGEGEEKKCVRELGEPCDSNQDCPLEYGECSPSAKGSGTKVCGCRGGYLPLGSNQECTRRRLLCNNCRHDEDCAYYGGVCSPNGKCLCPPNHHLRLESEEICWPSKALGETCAIAEECFVPSAPYNRCDVPMHSGGVNCTENVCVCSRGYHVADEADCRRDATELGQRCVTVEDCVFVGERTDVRCYLGKCACAEGYMPDGTPTGCVVGLGGPCAADEDCKAVQNGGECEDGDGGGGDGDGDGDDDGGSQPAGECRDGSCACRNGSVVSESGDVCLAEASRYEAPCKEEQQCAPLGANVACADCRCRCAEGFHWRDASCWEIRFVGDECTHMNQCIAQHSQCRGGYCQCEDGLTAAHDKFECQEEGGASVVGGDRLALTAALLGALLARRTLAP